MGRERIAIIGVLCGALLLALNDEARSQEAAPLFPPRVDQRVQPATHVQPIPSAPHVAPASTPANDPLPLAPRNVKNLKGATPGADLKLAAARPVRESTGPSLTTMFLSLGVVLGLFLCSMWFIRRVLPAAAPRLPADVVEVLGCTPLASRQSAHLLRVGNKLLLVSLFPSGAETLTEITDPVEVDRIAGLCRAQQPQSTTASFRSLLEQFGKERTAPGFIAPSPHELKSTADSGRDHEEDDDV